MLQIHDNLAIFEFRGSYFEEHFCSAKNEQITIIGDHFYDVNRLNSVKALVLCDFLHKIVRNHYSSMFYSLKLYNVRPLSNTMPNQHLIEYHTTVLHYICVMVTRFEIHNFKNVWI